MHDFWAANALDKTYEDIKDAQGQLVFENEDEFMAFRRRCNKVSYNLRKNQYAQLLAVKIDRTERRIQELGDILANKDTLHWDDKYGEDGHKDDDEVWSIDDIQVSKQAKIHLIAIADAVIQEQPKAVKKASPRDNRIHNIVETEQDIQIEHPKVLLTTSSNKTNSHVNQIVKVVSAQQELETEELARRMEQIDSAKLVERTVKYLRDLGLVKSEKDIEGLALRNVV